jgi:prepilin-type N-terminal cleavage/methylation domain-containing protein/prepilin-type processing-associated H-X9-DG protein
MKNRGGFTLVELLVVIAIIALLMSILMPTLSKAKKQAKDVMCQANLKQWASVFSMYADDNEGHFMAGWMGITLTKESDQWPEALRPYYLDSSDLRLCPSATKPASERDESNIWPASEAGAWGVFPDWVTNWGATPGDYGSYGINAWVCDPLEDIVYPGMEQAHWRGPNVRGAANVPVFGDCVWMEAWPVPTEDPPPFRNQYTNKSSSMSRLCIERHGTRINFLFLDFSVREVGLKELWILKWHRQFDTCGPWTVCGDVKPPDWPDWMQGLKDY